MTKCNNVLCHILKIWFIYFNHIYSIDESVFLIKF